MTSISPAQPRPPSSAFNPPILTSRSHLPSLVSPRPPVPSRTASRDGSMHSSLDDRPTKRRKIDEHGSPLAPAPTADTYRSESQEDQPARKYHRVSWTMALSARSVNAGLVKSESITLPPLPVPPWDPVKPEEPILGRVRTSCRVRADVAVPHVPDSLQQPCKVPVLEPKRPIDYFPWTGKHPEDIINEGNVQRGYWDRPPQPLERELNTARAPLYNAFKHRAGLDTLSTLFSLVLDRKAKQGALSTTSTFRPPPRVTLTEAKRKSWIADLADENVPLRRLSRTIPQGVRGAALLEQCLVHNVPTNRAIWFVKCVGANEIRTLKRKGANPTVVIGAEYKWLRDWTMNIEQFLDVAIGRCGSQNWLQSLRYCLHLCTRLYHENLLDKDHFLDWIVKSFSGTGLEFLAVWLSLVQMWRIDLVRFRRRARSLAVALLSKFQELVSLGSTHVLQERLQKAIQGLAVFRPACFLLPDRWTELRESLKSCLDLTDEREAQVFEHLDHRNARMLGRDFRRDEPSPEARKVFQTLDDSAAPFDINQISRALFDSCSDSGKLSHFCLQWATSKFRGGVERIYLIARLVRRWLRDGLGISDRILSFFSYGHRSPSVDSSSYRHLFAELSRSQSFSSSRFLQNLTLRGFNTTQQHDNQETSSTTLEGHLLQDLTLLETEEHLVNLKDHLLRRIGRTSPYGMEHIRTIKDGLKQALQEAENAPGAPQTRHVQLLSCKELDWSTRFAISQWLRIEAGHLAQLTAIEIPGRPPLPGSRILSLHQFLIIRDVLESLGDIAILADVLSMLCRTKQESILAAIVDTIHCNAEALSAIGALEPLQKTCGHAYVALRALRPSLMLFATALVDLCQYFPSTITPVRALQQDLIRGDRGRALAACSPFSDGIAESLQQAGATFVDDFEGILQGEPNMSEQTMIFLFQILVGRIMKSDGESHDQSTFALCQLLARLRLFRTSQGDVLIKKWISRLFTAAWSATHQGIILELISTRCISIEALLDVCEPAPPNSSCRIAVLELVAKGLLSKPPPSLEYQQQTYVVRIAVGRMLTTNPVRVLEVLITRGTPKSEMLGTCAIMLPSLLEDRGKLSTISAPMAKCLPSIVEEFLGISSEEHDILSKILSLTDWLSIQFCQYRLNLQPEGSDVYRNDLNKAGTLVLDALETKCRENMMDSELIQALVNAMPNEVSSQVRALKEQQFYNTVPRSLHGRGINQALQYTAEDKERCMQVVEGLIALGPAKFVHATADTNGMLIEKLTIIHKILGAKGDVTQGVGNGTSASSPVSPSPVNGNNTAGPIDHRQRETIMTAMEHMELISRVASMKAGSFGGQVSAANSAPSKQVQTEQMKILALLASIATQPVLTQLLQADIEVEEKRKIRECVNLTLDVAARMADDLSEEARGQCARVLKEKVRDERISWLVGSMNMNALHQNAAGQGLTIMHEAKGYIGEFRPKQWEMLESGGGKEGDTCLGLGLFGAKRL